MEAGSEVYKHKNLASFDDRERIKKELKDSATGSKPDEEQFKLRQIEKRRKSIWLDVPFNQEEYRLTKNGP